jgi:hypothetical protein
LGSIGDAPHFALLDRGASLSAAAPARQTA